VDTSNAREPIDQDRRRLLRTATMGIAVAGASGLMTMLTRTLAAAAIGIALATNALAQSARNADQIEQHVVFNSFTGRLDTHETIPATVVGLLSGS
jgi:hypothetical protein